MNENKPAEIPVLIPPEQLSEDALEGIVESFVLREGTDYGAVEVGHDKKIQQVRKQIARGDIKIIFDTESETVSLLTSRDFQTLMLARQGL